MHLYQLNYKIGEFARSHKMSSFISCTFPLFADFAVSPNNSKLWRIDYNLVANHLEKQLKRAVILPDAVHSDHCPVLLEIEF